MKFNLVAAVVAAAALAEAAPLRVLMITGGPLPPSRIDGARFGHGVPLPPDVARIAMPHEGHHGHHDHPNGRPSRMRGPCAGRMGSMRAKALEMSNAFRKALGLPLIEPDVMHHGHMHHGGDHNLAKIIPTFGTPTFIDYKMMDGKMQVKTKGGEAVQILNVNNLPHPHPHSQIPSHMSFFNPSEPFLVRLESSLMNLGMWEAAAVSFVLGCGIGVLLRMFYVLTILAIRSIKGPSRDEYEYTHITVIEDIEDAEEAIKSPPPTYAYPVDEKHAEEVSVKTTTAPN